MVTDMSQTRFRGLVIIVLLIVISGAAPVQAAAQVLRAQDAAFVSLALGMMLIPWDQQVYDGMQQLPGSSSILWKGISLVGHPGAALGTAFGLAAAGSKFGEDLSRVLLVNSGVTLGLKSLTGMARPEVGKGPVMVGPTLQDEYGAFPSAHASTAFAAAAVVAHHYPEEAGWAYLAAALVGLSRIFVEAHWPSNVIFGAGLGYLSARLVLDWE